MDSRAVCRGRRVCPNAVTDLGGVSLPGLLVGSGTLSMEPDIVCVMFLCPIKAVVAFLLTGGCISVTHKVVPVQSK